MPHAVRYNLSVALVGLLLAGSVASCSQGVTGGSSSPPAASVSATSSATPTRTFSSKGVTVTTPADWGDNLANTTVDGSIISASNPDMTKAFDVVVSGRTTFEETLADFAAAGYGDNPTPVTIPGTDQAAVLDGDEGGVVWRTLVAQVQDLFVIVMYQQAADADSSLDDWQQISESLDVDYATLSGGPGPSATPTPTTPTYTEAEQAYLAAQAKDDADYGDEWDPSNPEDAAYSLKLGYGTCKDLEDMGDDDTRMIRMIGDEFDGYTNPVKFLCPEYAKVYKLASRGFDSGSYVVGEDIKPGTYETAFGVSDGNCYWERVTDNGDIIDNGWVRNAPKGVKVTIKKSDGGFAATDCGTWLPVD